MPYILRNAQGAITRASVQSIPGAEMVAYDHPDLVVFLQNNGQDPRKVYDVLDELRKSDGDMARAVEDVITALLKKNVLRLSDLPKQVQDRMAQRVKLRLSIQDIYDHASGQNSVNSQTISPYNDFYDRR